MFLRVLFWMAGIAGMLPMVVGLELDFSSVTPQQHQEMERWVQQLANSSWYIRREAGEKLLEFGLDALEVLRDAEENDDPTIASAARFYSGLLSRGMVRMTDSEKVKAILESYGKSDRQNAEIIQKINHLPQEEAIPLLMRILIYETQEETVLQAALAIWWKLPRVTVLHPVPSWIPHHGNKEPVDESVIQTQDDPLTIAALRKEYVNKIDAAIPADTVKKKGGKILKQLLELEKRLQQGNESENSLHLWLEVWYKKRLQELEATFKSFPPNSPAVTRKMQLWLDYCYCVGDLFAHWKLETWQKKWIAQTRLANLSHLVAYFQNHQERFADLFYRIDLIEKLAGRGHWEWSMQEAEYLLDNVQQVEIPLASSPLANLFHYCGNHVRAAEILQHCLQSVLLLNAMERLGIKEKDWEARAMYYLACQAGVENQADVQKKILREILEKEPLEADSLILCYRIAEVDSDTAWKEETEKRIQTALDEIVNKINDSVATDKAQNQNLFAWLAANTHRRLDEALEYANAAVETFPDSGGIRDTLAHVLLAQGKVEEAIDQQTKATHDRPNDLEIRRNLWRFQETLSRSTRNDAPTDEVPGE